MMRRGLYLSLFAVSLNVYAADISSSLPANIVLFGNTSLSTGTGASGLGIPRFTISNDSNILATQSGSWTTGRTWTLGSGTDLVSAVQSGSWTVTANAGTNLNTSALALSATQTNGSQKTQMVDGAGSVVGPVMSASGVNYLPVSQPVDVTSSTINVTTQDLASTTTTGFANQQLITGTPTANSAASYTVNSIQTVMVLIGGTWTGTLSTEVSEDAGITWEPRSIHVIGTSTFSASITGNVAGSMNGAGKTNIRVRATAAMTGTAVIKILTSDNPSNVYVANSIKLVDGSTTPNVNTLTIKSASTPASTTDTAAVVAISPNNTVTVQGPSGAPGTPSGGILTVQGVSGGTALPGNITQFGGTNISTGTGASGAGMPRVTVSNDSKVIGWDGTNTTVVKAGSSGSALTDAALVVTGRPDNVGTPTQTSVSCASTTTTLLAASTASMFLSVRNPTTATQTVWLNVTGVAAVAAAPSIDLAPGSEVDFFAEGASFLPTAQINCISGGTASTVTVVYK